MIIILFCVLIGILGWGIFFYLTAFISKRRREVRIIKNKKISSRVDNRVLFVLLMLNAVALAAMFLPAVIDRDAKKIEVAGPFLFFILVNVFSYIFAVAHFKYE